MNQNYKRNFEPCLFSQFNPAKKVRRENGAERPAFPLFQASPINPNNPSDNEHRAIYKASTKCKPQITPSPKPISQFKAKPMPNFSNPFVPKLFKHTTTPIQEFNLSCYYRNSSKASTASRCDTPESQFGSSFFSQRSEPSQPGARIKSMTGLNKFVLTRKSRENIVQEDMDIDGEEMDID